MNDAVKQLPVFKGYTVDGVVRAVPLVNGQKHFGPHDVEASRAEMGPTLCEPSQVPHLHSTKTSTKTDSSEGSGRELRKAHDGRDGDAHAHVKR